MHAPPNPTRLTDEQYKALRRKADKQFNIGLLCIGVIVFVGGIFYTFGVGLGTVASGISIISFAVTQMITGDPDA